MSTDRSTADPGPIFRRGNITLQQSVCLLPLLRNWGCKSATFCLSFLSVHGNSDFTLFASSSPDLFQHPKLTFLRAWAQCTHSSPSRILYEARLWSSPHWAGWCGCRRGDRAPSITLPAVSPRLLLAACFTGRSVKTGRALPAVLRPTKIKHLNIYIEYSQHICISVLWLIREHVSSVPCGRLRLVVY